MPTGRAVMPRWMNMLASEPPPDASKTGRETEGVEGPANGRYRFVLCLDSVCLVCVDDVQRDSGVRVAGGGFVEHPAELTLEPGQLVVAAAAELAVQRRRARG